jgi:hypothetical protein
MGWRIPYSSRRVNAQPEIGVVVLVERVRRVSETGLALLVGRTQVLCRIALISGWGTLCQIADQTIYSSLAIYLWGLKNKTRWL